nr:MAG TPA: hypothetical protein [Caudoviricetes sp.]
MQAGTIQAVHTLDEKKPKPAGYRKNRGAVKCKPIGNIPRVFCEKITISPWLKRGTLRCSLAKDKKFFSL